MEAGRGEGRVRILNGAKSLFDKTATGGLLTKFIKSGLAASQCARKGASTGQEEENRWEEGRRKGRRREWY